MGLAGRDWIDMNESGLSHLKAQRLTAVVEEARAMVRAEAGSIAELAERLDERTGQAIELILERTGWNEEEAGGTGGGGTLVVSGIGKSGLMGQRIAASFASTGTPAHFLHPVEAVHGDVGRVRRRDVALLLSYSGETDELTRLIDVLKRMKVPMVAITSKATSTLGRLSDVCIELGPIEEVCPLKLAPTTSVNCMSVVADALVLGVMGLRKFSADDFAAFHPAGSLGRKLLKVGQAMSFKVGENFTPIWDGVKVREAIAQDHTTESKRRAGALLMVDKEGRLSGIFSNGDFRRKLLAHGNLLEMPIGEVMTKNPKRILVEALASEALAMLNEYRILDLPVVDGEGRPVGMIDVQDLVTLRIVE